MEKDITMMYINKLYESEINILIYSDWDAGYYAKLGDEMNGFVVESGGFDTFAQAITFLATEVAKRYPKSEFAKWYNSPHESTQTV